MAEHEETAAAGKLIKTFTQIVEGDVERPFDTAAGDLVGSARVEENGAGLAAMLARREFERLAPANLFDAPLEDILDEVSRHVYRVLCRGVGRGIGKVELGEVGCVHARTDGGCNNIDALIGARAAHDLGAKDANTTFMTRLSEPG